MYDRIRIMDSTYQEFYDIMNQYDKLSIFQKNRFKECTRILKENITNENLLVSLHSSEYNHILFQLLFIIQKDSTLSNKSIVFRLLIPYRPSPCFYSLYFWLFCKK
jgi:hypothetical protein